MRDAFISLDRSYLQHFMLTGNSRSDGVGMLHQVVLLALDMSNPRRDTHNIVCGWVADIDIAFAIFETWRGGGDR